MPHDQNEQGPVINEKVERDRPANASKKKLAQSNNHEVSREALVGELKKDLEAGIPLTKTPAQPTKKKRKRRTKAEMEAARAAQAIATPQPPTPQPPAPKAEAPKKKKRKRRTKAEMEAARAAQAIATKAPPAPQPAPAPTPESEEAPAKKRRRRKQWRKGRVWPTYKFSLYMVMDSKIVKSFEGQLTKKPVALQDSMEKLLKKFTVEEPPKE